ncbi:MAG TPA: DUF6167 family protein [Nocardioidaceae bacterium]|jgi:hypothetical protein
MFWFAAGAASGVYTLVKVRRTAQNLTPDGVAARVAAWGVGARLFRDEVALGMEERERELRAQLRVPAPARRELEQGRELRTERATGAAAAATASLRANA